MKKTKGKKIDRLQAISTKGGADSKWKIIAEWNRKHKDALDDFVVIAGHIRKTLKEKEWTQTELAEKMEVTPQALTRIMKGRQNLSLQTIRKIEQVLDVRLITVHKTKTVKSQKVKMVSVVPNYEKSMSKKYDFEIGVDKNQQNMNAVSERVEPYNQAS
ncbi:MAG: helix-turn-helix domain-containing protein [Bacteroidetes bacterium]|jgi:transcriptional regulator with XRE-family HTH domain|nr:helix-turn-helix domain-containing protein [Bacteroidota bacterium]